MDEFDLLAFTQMDEDYRWLWRSRVSRRVSEDEAVGLVVLKCMGRVRRMAFEYAVYEGVSLTHI